MIHLDTSFLIDLHREVVRARPGEALDLIESFDPNEVLAVSVHVVCELRAGPGSVFEVGELSTVALPTSGQGRCLCLLSSRDEGAGMACGGPHWSARYAASRCKRATKSPRAFACPTPIDYPSMRRALPEKEPTQHARR